MSLSEEYELDIGEEHCRTTLTNMHGMRNKDNCDFVISIRERSIYVDKNVVRAASDYFNAMFYHDTVERQQGIVHMKDVEYFAVEKCVDFIYTGKLSVSFEQCHDVLFSATLMQLNTVREKICLFLQSHVETETFFEIRSIALKFVLGSLEKFCDRYAIGHISTLSKLDEFNCIDVSYLKVVLFPSMPRALLTEDAKLAIVIQWIKAEQNDREDYMVELLDEINFTKLTSVYCKTLFSDEPLCQVSIHLLRTLFSAITNHNGTSISSPDVPPKPSQPPNALIISNEETHKVLSYFPSNDSIEEISDYQPLMRTSNFTACSTDSHMYVFLEYKAMYCLNYVSRIWTKGPPLMYLHGVVARSTVHEGYLYIGGENLMERLNLQEASSWERVDLKELFCDNSAILTFRKYLYIIGGLSKVGTPLKDVVRKFPHTKWSPVNSMHVARKDPGATVYDNKIYVTGGDIRHDDLYKIEIFNDKTNSWTILRSKNFTGVPLYLYVADNQLFGIGTSMFKAFDFNQQVWKEVDVTTMKNKWYPGTASVYLAR